MLLASFESAFVFVGITTACIIGIAISGVSKGKARNETMKKLREDDSLEMCTGCDGAGVRGLSEKVCWICKGRGYIKSPPPPAWLVQANEPEDDPVE